jgi:predicted AAA+ superfamily ATPase
MSNDPYAIPEEKIIQRIRFENPWWKTNSIDSIMDKMRRRLYFNLFFSLLMETSFKRAVILMGPRRVGKTVMMYHAIQELIANHVLPNSIVFVGVDNPIYINLGLEELMNLAGIASGKENLDNTFVFFDEIQYLKDWERHLKVLVDSYPKTKFIASGSAAAALKVKSSESGAGRFHDFMLPPLTFQEYLHLQNLQHLVQPSESVYKGLKIQFFKTFDVKTLNEHFFFT